MAKPTIEMAWAAVLSAVQASTSAPLSARQALHAAVLMDQFADIVFSLRSTVAQPVLAAACDLSEFRLKLRALAPCMSSIMDLTACSAEGPWLEVRSQAVADDEFSSLPVADLMVSLYNNGTVPRLMLMQRDGPEQHMQPLLQNAIKWWDVFLGIGASGVAYQRDRHS